jgi:hypothetical protein
MTVIVDGVQASIAPNGGYNLATFAKADVTVAGSSGAWTTANSPITMFTVTGTVKLRITPVVTTPLTSTGATGTLALGLTSQAALFIAATTIDGTKLHASEVWQSATPTTASKAALLNNSSGWYEVHDDTIVIAIATNNMTAGGMRFDVDWIAVTAGATVVAATP